MFSQEIWGKGWGGVRKFKKGLLSFCVVFDCIFFFLANLPSINKWKCMTNLQQSEKPSRFFQDGGSWSSQDASVEISQSHHMFSLNNILRGPGSVHRLPTWTPNPLCKNELARPGARATLKASPDWHINLFCLRPHQDEWQETRRWPWRADYKIPLSTRLPPLCAS